MDFIHNFILWILKLWMMIQSQSWINHRNVVPSTTTTFKEDSDQQQHSTTQVEPYIVFDDH